MRLLAALLLAGALAASAQTQANDTPSWRAGLQKLPPTPGANTTAQDVAQFERNMRLAAPYLGNTTPTANPAQWEENRALVRRMAAYLYGLQVLSSNRQLRGPIMRAQRSFDTLGFAPYLAVVNAGEAPYSEAPPPAPEGQETVRSAPPWAMNAPEMGEVSSADKQTAADLRTRYETDAAHSAGVWQNAETLRQNLEMRGLGLNLETATGMVRLPQHFNSASNALKKNDWDTALTHLQQAEAETDKIAKTVGR